MKSINFHKGYVFIIFNFCILTNSIAVAGVHKLSFKQLTIDEGLSGNTVNCITKDSEGLIWIGTDYGLNCYDGYSFKIYLNDPTDKTSISDNVVTEIYEDKTGILWVGVYGGINIFDKYTREFNNFALSIKTRKGDFIARYINTITEDPNGNIWVCTEIGLFIINPLTMQYEYFGIDNTNIKSNYFNYLCFGKSQNYIFNSKAIYTLIPEKKIFKELISVNTNISSMITFGDSLWITTNNEGVLTYKIDGVSLKKAVSNHKINIPAVKCCSNDDGLMYFASLTEIIAYHPLKNEVSRQSIEKEDRINLDKINSFYLDNQGILWIGKKGEGLLYTSPYLKKIEHYTLNDKTEFDFVTAFAEDTRSNLWVGEWDNGITNFNHANNTKINYKNIPGVPSSLSNNLVRDIYKDTNGRLWIATENGINCKLPGSKGFVRYLNMPVNQVGVYSIFEDSKNNIWIGTLGKGIMRYNARDDKFYPFLDSSLVYIDSNPKTYAFITCVAEDSAGCLWLGTYRGLAYLDVNNKTIQIYNKNSTSVQSLIINCILFDSRNRLWAGTSKGLLLFSNNNK